MIERCGKKPSGVERNISETPCSAMNTIASAVISGDSLTMRIRNPLRKPMNAATASASPMPRTKNQGPLSSPAKKDRITTTRPVSGPTERSMPPVSRTINCPVLTKASALARKKIPLMLRTLRNLSLTVVV